MYKSFAVAMVPALALARGKNDGSSRDDAFTATILDEDSTSITLHTWNVYVYEQGWQLHGDISVAFTDGQDNFGGAVCISHDRERFPLPERVIKTDEEEEVAEEETAEDAAEGDDAAEGEDAAADDVEADEEEPEAADDADVEADEEEPVADEETVADEGAAEQEPVVEEEEEVVPEVVYPAGYDCISMLGFIQIEDYEDGYGSKVVVTDGSQAEAVVKSFVIDPSSDDRDVSLFIGAVQWVVNSPTTSKTCVAAASGLEGKMDCTINIGFYRNWTTIDEEADVQLVELDAEAHFGAYGWFIDEPKPPTLSDEEVVTANSLDDPAKVKLVSWEAIDRKWRLDNPDVEVVETDDDEDQEKNTDTNTDDADADQPGAESNDDGATSVTTMAAALFAAIYALAF